jgi:hypothetical protein
VNKPDYPLIAGLEHSLAIKGHEEECVICRRDVNGIAFMHGSRNGPGFYVGPDGRRFLTERDAMRHYQNMRGELL